MPELLVAPMKVARHAVIVELEWIGFRVRVCADGGDGLTAELCLGADGEGASREIEHDRVEELPATQRGAGTGAVEPARARRVTSADGAVRGAQL